jgi:hypothetical protein
MGGASVRRGCITDAQPACRARFATLANRPVKVNDTSATPARAHAGDMIGHLVSSRAAA